VLPLRANRATDKVHGAHQRSRRPEVRGETLRCEYDGKIATVTLDRPEKKNAIDWRMWHELMSAFDSVERTDGVRILVVRGSGGAFCSGADLSGDAPDMHPLQEMQFINRVIARLHRLSKVTLAVVDGVAVGAGCNLALACDLVVATERSRFSQIFVRRGMSVDCGGSWVLPRLIGMHAAKELCLTGEFVAGLEAKAMGLVNRCEPVDEIDRVVDELVEKLLQAAPVAQTLTKRLLNEGAQSDLEAALDAEAAAQLVNLGGSDVVEARSAFLERREATFTGAWGSTR
jgi:enoyl-CoA hydratase/carnithine racemase